jgi:phage terminase small subunit
LALRDKQAAFVNEYLIDFNATRAAQRAGYTGNENTLGVTGHDLLRNPKIAEVIRVRLNEAAMTADEVLMRLAAQGRADMGPWLTDDGEIDIAAMKRDRATHLIHKVKRTERSGETNSGGSWNQVTTEIELHPAQSALVTLGKHHKLWVDRQEVMGKDGGPIVFEVIYGDDGAETPTT